MESPAPPRPRARPPRLALLCLLLLTALPPPVRLIAAEGETVDERRALIGVKLFRSTLAADLAIDRKVTARGELLLLVLHAGNRPLAEDLAQKLIEGGPVRELPVRVELTADPQLAAFAAVPPAGVFLAEPLRSRDQFTALAAFGRRHHVLLFSPFEGDVEEGLPAGLFIAARVSPYLNLEALAESRIEIKDFFLRVARQVK